MSEFFETAITIPVWVLVVLPVAAIILVARASGK